MKEWEDLIRTEMAFLDYAPIVFLSALTKRRLHTLFEPLNMAAENHKKRVVTHVLNDVIMDAVAMNPTHEAGKAVVIVVNKWDAIEKTDKTMKEWEDLIRTEMAFLDYAPIVFLSALTKRRLHTLFEPLNMAAENHKKRVVTHVLNDVIMDAVAMNPTPTHNGQRLRIYYATQVSTQPPTFVVFVNDPELLHFSYKRYLENCMRQAFHNGQRLRIYYATQVSTQPPTFVVFVNDPELLHFSYKRYLENCMRQAFGFEGTPIHIIARNRD